MSGLPELKHNETAFFLPPKGEGQDTRWHSISNVSEDIFRQQQTLYARCCIYGANAIAAHVREKLKNTQPIDLRELYDIAGDIRQRTAQAIPTNYAKEYGQWIAGKYQWGETIVPNSDMGVALYDKALAMFTALKTEIENHPDDTEYKGYATESSQDPPTESITYQHDLLEILNFPKTNPPAIKIYRPKADWIPHIFRRAEAHLNQFLAHPRQTPGDEWKHFSLMYQTLFHASPFQLGSQTATLMVLAGILKGVGYELLPIQCEADHFIDTAFKTPKTYRDMGSRIFGNRPPSLTHAPLPELEDIDVFFANMKQQCASLSGKWRAALKTRSAPPPSTPPW